VAKKKKKRRWGGPQREENPTPLKFASEKSKKGRGTRPREERGGNKFPRLGPPTTMEVQEKGGFQKGSTFTAQIATIKEWELPTREKGKYPSSGGYSMEKTTMKKRILWPEGDILLRVEVLKKKGMEKEGEATPGGGERSRRKGEDCLFPKKKGLINHWGKRRKGEGRNWGDLSSVGWGGEKEKKRFPKQKLKGIL